MGIVMVDNKLMMSGGKMVSYVSPPLAVKGQILSMDLDGNGEKQYRVLKCNGNVAQVMAMYDDLKSAYNSTNTTTTMGTLTVQKYEGSTLDTYLNTTWYNTLADNVKAAIVPESVVCDAWYWGNSGDPDYTGTYGTAVPGTSNYTISKYAGGTLNIGERNVFALSIQDVIDYLNDSSVQVDTTAILRNVNIWKMFWNVETQPTSITYPWLRSSGAGGSSGAWLVYSRNGSLDAYSVRNSNGVRPALNLNLSKVPFTLAGGGMTETETWILNEATTLPPSTVINFSYNGADYTQIISGEEEDTSLELTIPYTTFVAVSGNNLTFTGDAGDTGMTWSPNTVLIFSESPTGELLTWLQANATKQ